MKIAEYALTKLRGLRYGFKNPDYLGRLRVRNAGGFLSVGRRADFYDDVFIDIGKGAVVKMGDNVSLSKGVKINSLESITIGNDVVIASGAGITDNDHGFADMHTPIRLQPSVSSPVAIEDDVWIGFNAAILKGVRIGGGSVIGAGSVVTRNIPPYSVAAGVPARIIRNRAADSMLFARHMFQPVA